MSRGGRDGLKKPVLAGLLAAALLGFARPATAQTPPSPGSKPEVLEALDPYTKGEAKALERAGYLTLAPVEWAEGIRADAVKETLGGIEILWVETPHFKIGSTLETYKSLSDPKEEDKVEAELVRLKKKLARFKDPHNKFDPWMRLHLYAQRLEDAYAAFTTAFGLTAADFPEPGARGPEGDAKLGGGPYLGQQRKFTVLLLEKTSSLARFAKRYADREEHSWDRFPLPGGSIFLGVSAEGLRQFSYDLDAAMHALVACEITKNFLGGFRESNFTAPLWLECGLGHAAARRVDERFAPAGMAAPSPSEPDAWKWEPRVRGLVENDVATPWKDMLAWNQFEDLKVQGQLVAWSRASWLLSKPPAELRAFLIGETEPLEDAAEGEALARARLEREQKAVEKAFGKKLEELDAEWSKHVKRRYAKS